MEEKVELMQERNSNGEFKKRRNKLHLLSLKYFNIIAYDVQKDLGWVLMRGQNTNKASKVGVHGGNGTLKNEEVLCMW